MWHFHNFFNFSELNLRVIIHSKDSMSYETKGWNISLWEYDFGQSFLLGILVELYDLGEFITTFLSFCQIRRNDGLSIFILEFLIFWQSYTFGKIDISIQINDLSSNINFITDIEIIGQLDPIMCERSSIININASGKGKWIFIFATLQEEDLTNFGVKLKKDQIAKMWNLILISM